ncbi:hypothetical protein Rsub_08282 [Raphidocelis subcapitata]|uniref:DUF1499 domain-containing protein n=1 Tax=Raphidocelis subcapitata TaxID=307507 RepID=A0A2V0P5V6_9CHLO|nr:hypothetical protein Rsub_08282 [Raphidocelis subcapitata]|eukprot:GBF95251.1 hypothetical protein Rsub_08282 [Raphidocelis subcapitata]
MQKPLIGNGRRRGPSIQRLMWQGGALAAVGIGLVGAAVSVGHGFGAAVGFVAVVAGLVLLSYAACERELAATAPPRALPHHTPPPALPRGALPLLNALCGFALAALLVRVVSTDPRGPEAFPAACTKLQGCARVALLHPLADGGQAPLKLSTSLDGAQAAVAAWLRGRPRTDLLYAGEEAGSGGAARLVHARAVTFVWGFADDVWVQLSCGADGRALVEAMGQLRLGVSDLGVNAARNAELFAALRKAAAGGQLPAGKCSG